MNTQHTEHTRGPRSIVVAGDEQLTREFILRLESKGFTVASADDAPAAESAGSGFVAGIELTIAAGDSKKERLLRLEACLSASAPIISASVSVTAARQAAWMQHPERLIGLCAFPGLMNGPLAEIAIPVHTREAALNSARDLLAELGSEAVIVQDRVGMIFPGIIAQVINESLFAARQNVASAEDIDTAMKLGAGYPLGPIEWGETIGFAHIAGLLDAMRAETGEERYRVAPLLRQLALSGKFWHKKPAAPEAVQEVLPLDDVAIGAPAAPPQTENGGQKKKRGKKQSNPE